MRTIPILRQLLAGLVLLPLAVAVPAMTATAGNTLRVATFNTSLNDDQGRLATRLRRGDERARKIAAVIQRVRPDLLLLNEFDYDEAHESARRFVADYLGEGQFGEQPIDYAYRYLAPVNTGVPSGLDINADGKVEGPNDAWGFGRHPGQYGMLVLSRFPLQSEAVRSFQLLRWSAMPGALRPMQADGSAPFQPDEVWTQLRLSSKSHWDLPVQTPLGELHFLVSHPTPPVFDGPENLNGMRNHDEIRLWAEYLDDRSGDWLQDDRGRRGGLPAQARFVIAGDLNADPHDGANVEGTIQRLLDHPRVARYPAPRSDGALESGEERPGRRPHQTALDTDTAQFGPSTGNLRVDYVLPSVQFDVVAGGVFWPRRGEVGGEWLDASDHHMVWIDLELKPDADAG